MIAKVMYRTIEFLSIPKGKDSRSPNGFPKFFLKFQSIILQLHREDLELVRISRSNLGDNEPIPGLFEYLNVSSEDLPIILLNAITFFIFILVLCLLGFDLQLNFLLKMSHG